jgi:hypothetical protein
VNSISIKLLKFSLKENTSRKKEKKDLRQVSAFSKRERKKDLAITG